MDGGAAVVAAVMELQGGDQFRDVQLLVDSNQEMFGIDEVAQALVSELEQSRVPSVAVQRFEHHIPLPSLISSTL